MTTEPNTQPLAGSILADVPVQQQPSAAKPKADRLRSAKRTRERLVLLSMALVTAAAAGTLYTLLSYSVSESVLGGAALWAVLITAHQHIKNDAEIARLKAEILKLETQRFSDSRSVASESAEQDGAPVRPSSRAPNLRSPVAQPSGPVGPQPAPRWEQPGHAGVGVQRPAPNAPLRRPPADQVAPTPNPTAVAETALWPGTSVSAADPMRDQWAFRPRENADSQNADNPQTDSPVAEPAPSATSSIDADLAMVQRKIKALADEVNAADMVRDQASPAAQPSSSNAKPQRPQAPLSPAAQASALEASIDELKATAGHMRTGNGSGTSRPGQQLRSQATAQSRPAAAAGPMPSGQGQSLPFELVIPATAERIAVSQPTNPTLSIADALAPEQHQTSRPDHLELPQLPTLPELAPDARPENQAAAQSAVRPEKPKATPVAARNPRLAAIVDALASGEMDVFLSPIVALQSHQVSHYDVTVRLKSAQGQYLDNAEQELQLAGSDVLALFDTARLRRAATLAHRLDAHNKSGALLSSVNGPSITNAEFLETFARVFEERDRISNQLVLTFTQADLEQFTPSAWQALGDMQAFGFRFALSQIDHVAMDFAALASRGFAFLRLDAHALMNGLPARDRFIEAQELCHHLAGAGMTLVADTIDDESVRARVFGFGVLFGQGRLFGGARQIKLDQLPKGSAAAA